MEATEEKQACTAYTRYACTRPRLKRFRTSSTDRRSYLTDRYVLDIGQSQDWLGLQVAIAPCLLGYGALAKMLHGDSRSIREGNHYWSWVENYVADDYVQAVKTGSGEFALQYRHSTSVETTGNTADPCVPWKRAP